MKKIQLYIISLWLLFFLVAVKEFIFISWTFSFTCENIMNFLSVNLISLVSFCLSLLGLFYYARFNYFLKGSTKLPKKIIKIEDQSYEHLTFLTTYIIPFLRVKLEGKDLVVTILLLIIIGAIFVKTNLFYKNPTLALLGYKLYKVDTEKNTGLIFISKQNLKLGDDVHHIPLSDNVYFVKL
ncbi:anti-phage protein KwaA [Flavobacterium sp. Arc2]|uniref:anti-phage protein KwaA n=1 Tax=Flavobacterium sp. Arc2 TaxID=3046685 RepID=UPI00352FEAE6